MPFVGIGVGIGRQRFGGGIFAAYAARVAADGGVTEAGACVNAVSGISLNSSLLLVPSGYKSGVVYSQIPTNGDGDLTFTRASSATRVNSDGEIEVVGSGVPRLDYSQGSCPALLLEPQRTNLLLRSEEFNIAWQASFVNVTPNTTISPDGNQNADTITSTSVLHIIAQNVTVLASTVYTFSFWVLRGTMTDLKYSVYNLSTPGEIIAPTSYYSQTNSSTWTRVNVTFTTPVGCTSINIYPLRDSGVIGSVYLWGAQLEQGSYATSYIKTTSATVTRLADSFTRNNIYTNGLISSSGGTWFVELKNNVVFPRTNFGALYLGDATTFATSNNNFYIRNNGGASRLSIGKVVGGVITGFLVTTTDTVKIAIKWNGTNSDLFVNGVKETSSSAFTTTILEHLNCIDMNGIQFIQAMQLYPTPLSDSDCISLTT